MRALAVLLLPVLACVPPSLDDDSTGDDDAAGDDDTADDDTADDDTAGDDDDDIVGDDDTPIPPGGSCAPEEVLDADCTVLPLRTWDLSELGLYNCGEGTWIFAELGGFESFVADCAFDGGPNPTIPMLDVDWDDEHLVVQVQGDSGCSFESGINWVASCGDVAVLSSYSIGCGACQMYGLTVLAAAIPAVDTLDEVSCVPDEAACDDDDAPTEPM